MGTVRLQAASLVQTRQDVPGYKSYAPRRLRVIPNSPHPPPSPRDIGSPSPSFIPFSFSLPAFNRPSKRRRLRILPHIVRVHPSIYTYTILSIIRINCERNHPPPSPPPHSSAAHSAATSFLQSSVSIKDHPGARGNVSLLL